MKPIIVIPIVIIAIIGIVIGLVAYSYTQIRFSLETISYQGLDFTTPSYTALLKLGADFLTGNWIGFALTLVTGVKLGLAFGLSNHGFFPVYIPDVSYDVLVNGVKIGQGQSHIASTINPGDTKSFQDDTQDIQFASIEPAIISIVSSGGMVNFQVSGTAYFNFLGINVPVPFQASKQINVVDEIKNHFSSYLNNNQQSSQNSYQANQGYAPQTQPATQNPSSSTGVTIVNSAYRVEPGTYTYIPFTLSCTASTTGSFAAQAALGNNIVVIVLDQNNFQLVSNHQQASAFYNSGKIQAGSFNLTLQPGTYYIVLSNTYSAFSTKTVSIAASYTCS